MKISLSSFLYFNYTLEEAIRRTAAAGFTGIDVWGGRPHAYRNDLSERELATLRQLLEDEGLQVASMIPAQFRYPTSLCSPIRVIQRDSIRYIQDSINTAAGLGAPMVSVCPGHTLYGQSREDGLARLKESLWEIAQFAARLGIQVAIEPADRYETDLLNTCRETLDLIRETGIDNLGVLLDNGHAQVVGESAVEAIEMLGDRLYHVHVDDNNGERDQHLVPGDGTFTFPPLIEALRSAGYSGFLCAELSWDYTVDPDPAAKATADRLQTLLET